MSTLDPAARPPVDLGPRLGWRFAARAVRWTDADTIVVDCLIDVGFEEMTTKRRKVRLLGIDAPELHSADADERARANVAAEFANELVAPGELLTVIIVKPDKYGGRDDGHVWTADGTHLGRAILEAGHAVPYDGGPR